MDLCTRVTSVRGTLWKLDTIVQNVMILICVSLVTSPNNIHTRWKSKDLVKCWVNLKLVCFLSFSSFFFFFLFFLFLSLSLSFCLLITIFSITLSSNYISSPSSHYLINLLSSQSSSPGCKTIYSFLSLSLCLNSPFQSIFKLAN